MSCLDCHDYMDGYNRGKREGTIEELNEIKKEIEELTKTFYIDPDVFYIIDKRLLELKGEK